MTGDGGELPQEKPLSHGTLLFSALQHIAIIAPIGLVFPLLVLRAADAGFALQEAVVTASLLALGIGNLLLCLRGRMLGSGYLCPAVFTAAYLPASLAAADAGGLSLVFGMTIFAGLCEVAFSFLLRRLRPYLPAEIAGLAVVMIGLILGFMGFRLMLGLDSHGTFREGVSDSHAVAFGLLALALLIVLNVWGRGVFKLFAVLICIGVIYPLAAVLGQVELPDGQQLSLEGLIDLPNLPYLLPSFDITLAVPFMIGALACALRATGDITTCQRIADDSWVRPDMDSIARGVRADGLATACAGLLGAVGLNSFSSSIGLSQATGVIQRRVGLAIGGLFFVLALSPDVVMLAIGMPQALTGAILVFSSAFILSNGLSIIVARLLDARRILTIGVALVFGLSHDVFPEFYDHFPLWLKSISGSSLVVALVLALVLNALFRIGVKRTAELELPLDSSLLPRMVAFCREQGALWGARRDVMERMANSLTEAGELALARGYEGRPLKLHVNYDEFRIRANLEFTVAYPDSDDAPEPPASTARTSPDEDGLEYRLMRHFADSVRMVQNRGQQQVKLVFET